MMAAGPVAAPISPALGGTATAPAVSGNIGATNDASSAGPAQSATTTQEALAGPEQAESNINSERLAFLEELGSLLEQIFSLSIIFALLSLLNSNDYDGGGVFSLLAGAAVAGALANSLDQLLAQDGMPQSGMLMDISI